MGQKMSNNSKGYKVLNSEAAMPAGDKQQPFSVKKVPLRELPNELRNLISKPPGSSAPSKDKGHVADTNETRNITAKLPESSSVSKDREHAVDTAKLSGIKRQRPDSPSSASSFQPSGNVGVNGHIVYVRRRLESEPSKISHPDNASSADSPGLKKDNNNGMKEKKGQSMLAQEPKSIPPVCAPTPVFPQTTQESKPIAPVCAPFSAVPRTITEAKLTHPVCAPIPPAPRSAPVEGISLSDIVGKPITGLAATELKSMAICGTPVQAEPQRTGNMDWRERFVQLQMFLKSCDQSSQENYIQKLRTLSAAGRSRHAVELEKRAIQLLLEEGRELQRMKVLNVLGKALPKDNTLLSTQSPSLQAHLEREDRRPVGLAKPPFLSNA